MDRTLSLDELPQPAKTRLTEIDLKKAAKMFSIPGYNKKGHKPPKWIWVLIWAFLVVFIILLWPK
jgi:hypothetical protein